MKLTAQQVYDKLINEERILEVDGRIKFYLGSVDIVVKQRDVVGNIIQEWLEGWLKRNDIEYDTNENTQMPPDFFLNTTDRTKDLLEVKAFYCKASPAFDIADFVAYQREIIAKPYMLYVDYLIFAYDMLDDGTVVINNLWLKKVWQMTRRMAVFPITVQYKNGRIQKMRPGDIRKPKNDSQMYRCLEDYISAIEETVYMCDQTHTEATTWKQRFLNSYKQTYGISLVIPRFNDIKDTYPITERSSPRTSTAGRA